MQNGFQRFGRLQHCCDSNAEEDGERCIGVIRADSFIGMNLLSKSKLMPLSFSGVLYLHKTLQGDKCHGVITLEVTYAPL